jgi:hypothetical protein
MGETRRRATGGQRAHRAASRNINTCGVCLEFLVLTRIWRGCTRFGLDLPFPFAWISLDSLVRITILQGVTDLERREKFARPSAATNRPTRSPSRSQWDSRSQFHDRHKGYHTPYSGFQQEFAAHRKKVRERPDPKSPGLHSMPRLAGGRRMTRGGRVLCRSQRRGSQRRRDSSTTGCRPNPIIPSPNDQRIPQLVVSAL